MVFNDTYNNISVLFVEETGVPGENYPPVTSHWHTLGVIDIGGIVDNHCMKYFNFYKILNDFQVECCSVKQDNHVDYEINLYFNFWILMNDHNTFHL